MLTHSHKLLFQTLRERDLQRQREAVRALSARARFQALDVCLAGATYEPDEGFGRLCVPGVIPLDAQVDAVWWEQAGRMLLAAFADSVPSVRTLLDRVVSLSVRCRAGSAYITTDLSHLKHFPRLERLELVGYFRGDPLSELAAIASLRALRLERPSLPEGVGALAGLNRLERLTLVGDIKTLGEVPALPALKSLTVRDAPALSLAPLAGLTSLEELTFGAVLDDDLRALSSMPSLRALALAPDRARPLPSLAGLEACASLESLDISGASVDSLAPLAGRALRSLTVSHTRLTRLDGPDLSALAHLDAAGTDLEDLDALRGGAALQTLDVHGCAKLRSIEGVAKAAHLQRVDLSGCASLRSLAPLRGGLRLESLAFRPAERLRDLTDLARCTALRALFLDGATRVTDLSPLRNLTALARLSLRECGAVDVRPLATLDQLVSLDLRGCKGLSEVGALDALRGLKVVALAGSGVAQKDLSESLGAKVTWSGDAALEGHPAVRRSVAPRGTGAQTRRLVASIRKLVTSRDLEQITQGVELLRTLGDGAIYDMLLDGVAWVDAGARWVDREGKTRRAGAIGEWAVTRVFDGDAARAARDHSIAMLVGSAPERSARATALRERATSLSLAPVEDSSTIDLGAVSGFNALRALHFGGAARVLRPEALGALASLQTLTVQGGGDTGWMEHVPPSLTSVEVLEGRGLTEVDLSGASALQTLSLWGCNGLARVVVHPSAPLQKLEMNACASLRGVSVPVARLRWLTLERADTRALAEFLATAKGVEELDLSGAHMPDVTPLLGMASLSVLKILGVRGLDDLAPLTALPNLRKIVVRNKGDHAPLPYHYPQSLRAIMVSA